MSTWTDRRLLVSLTLLLLAGCGHEGEAGRTRGRTVVRLMRVEVVQPVRKRLTRNVELAATVEPLKRVELCARVPGVVGWLPDEMDIGRKVKTGEVLLKLSVPDLEADRKHKSALWEQARKQLDQSVEAEVVARREVEEAQKEEKRYAADVAYQEQRHGRIRNLVRSRAQDPQMEDEALKQLRTAEAALESNKAKVQSRQAKARAALADIEVAKRRIEVAAAEVQRLDELLGFAVIKAPFDGVITRRWVDPGATIKDPGAVLLTVMQISRVRVLVDVPQRDVALLNAREQNPNPDGKGDPVKVYISSLAEAAPRGEFLGELTRVSRSLDPVTRTMRAEVEMDNAQEHFQPGMYGKATITVEDRSDVLSLPASAVARKGENVVEAYVVTDIKEENGDRTGILRKVAVTLGIDDGKEVEVRGGLKGDELVVVRSNGQLRMDERVVAVPLAE